MNIGYSIIVHFKFTVTESQKFSSIHFVRFTFSLVVISSLISTTSLHWYSHSSYCAIVSVQPPGGASVQTKTEKEKKCAHTYHSQSYKHILQQCPVSFIGSSRITLPSVFYFVSSLRHLFSY